MKPASPWLLALGTGVVVSLSLAVGLFRGSELFLEDRLFGEKRVDPRIVILAIDNESINKIGAWPWPRAVWAQLVRKLNEQKPAAVGFDVILSEPSLYGTTDDAALAQALATNKIPLVMPREANPTLEPLPLFKTKPSVSLGTVNFTTDPDGVVRTMTTEGSFAAVVAARSGAELAPRTGRSRIVFAGPPQTVPTISIANVLDGTSPASLKDRIVFVGATAADLHDEQNVPTGGGVPMSGVEIQAQAANMLLSGYRLASPTLPVQIALTLLLALLPAFFFSYFPHSIKPVSASILLGLIATTSALLMFDRGVTLNIIHLNLAWALSTLTLFAHRYFTTERERREMRHAFGKYVSKDILEEILANPTAIGLGGAERDATVFFSDVRGFTTLSEKLTAAELVAFLNKYLTVMTDIALEHRGVVDKYIGDAIMAFWGAPIKSETHALNATLASLEMCEALRAFNEVSEKQGNPPIDIGIGLNSGTVVAGNMGSTKRFDYTVMGDTVNLASRLEGQTKTYGVHIIASENTIAKLKPEDIEKHEILVREIDKIKVKGKTLPVTIFEIGERSRASRVRESLTAFAEARSAYYAGEFKKAAEIFAKISAADPADGPSRLLLDRCAYFLEHPPQDWNGVYEFKTK